MTRLLTTGAEEFEPSALWDVANLATSGDYVGQYSPPSYYTSANGASLAFAPRTGRGMYLLTAAQILRVNYGADTSHTELFWGFAMRVKNLYTSHFFTAYTDDPDVFTNYLSLRLSSAGAVQLVRSGTQLDTSANGVVTIDT